MLTIDRQKLCARTACFTYKQISGHYEWFFVSEQHAFSRPHRGQGWEQSGGADDGRHYNIRCRVRNHVLQCGRARGHFRF
jgi:hypothetical protein